MFFGRWWPSLRYSHAAMKEMFAFGSGVFAKRLLEYGANNLDNLVVGRVLGISALGFYDKGFVTVRRILSRLNTGGPMVSFRVLSLICEERDRFHNAYRKVLLAASLLAYPALLGLAALGPDLIPVAYGDRWEPTIVPFQILCVAGIFTLLTEYAGSAIQALGKIWGQVTRQLVHAGVVVILVGVFAQWGLPAAALGVLLSTFAMNVLMNTLLIKLTAITPRTVLRAQLPGLLCGLIVGGVTWGARWMALEYAPDVAQWQRLILQLIAGGLAYLAFIKFNRFGEVRHLVRETAEDLAPPFGPLARLFA
jgi:O-antigen/teichoic acid export membrane protein